LAAHFQKEVGHGRLKMILEMLPRGEKFSSVANGRNSREDGEKTNPVMKAIPQMKKLDTSKLKQLSLGRQVERGE
jgi:hypothetical protein